MIKKIIINFIIISILIAAIFTKYIKFIEINKVLPDIILILTVFNGLFFGPTYAMFFGFFFGLAFDISTYSLVGFWALIYTVVGYLTRVAKVIDIDNWIISSIVIFVFNLLKYAVFFIVGLLFIKTESVFNYFKNFALIESLYTLIVSIPIFILYKHFNKKSRNINSNV